eukprot:5611366-Prymnesium_polylepis.1
MPRLPVLLFLLLQLAGSQVAATCCSGTCQYEADDDCDDGGPGSEYDSCSLGTDCSDCGSRCSAPPPSVVPIISPPPAALPPPVPRCLDDPQYFDIYRCSEWAGHQPGCRSGVSTGILTPERIALLVYSCPQSCSDVEPNCVPPKPPPPMTAPSPPMPPVPPQEPPLIPPPRPRCVDDPNYFDVYSCSDWAGYPCHPGSESSITTPEQIARLVYSCPESCSDVTPDCVPPLPPLLSPPPLATSATPTPPSSSIPTPSSSPALTPPAPTSATC